MLKKTRYFIEFISLPAFILLSTHLTSSALHKLMDIGKHNHLRITEHGHIFTIESAISVLVVAFFAWIWHQPKLKKFVPCNHEHCHGEQSVSHILAIIALCLHFFPEATVRQHMISNMNNSLMEIIVAIGFSAHFMVDVLVAILISSFWQKKWQYVVSLITIVSVWIIAFLLAHKSLEYQYIFTNPLILLLSSFLLAMFIHKPHKTDTSCCDSN